MNGISRLRNRGSLNLEMALLIMLLVLAVVASLSLIAHGIDGRYGDVTARLGIAGGSASAPHNGGTGDVLPDGSYPIDWIGGNGPFTIIRGTNPELTDGETIGIIPDRNYDIPVDDLLVGDNWIGIIDSDNNPIDTPIYIAKWRTYTGSVYLPNFGDSSQMAGQTVYAFELDLGLGDMGDPFTDLADLTQAQRDVYELGRGLLVEGLNQSWIYPQVDLLHHNDLTGADIVGINLTQYYTGNYRTATVDTSGNWNLYNFGRGHYIFAMQVEPFNPAGWWVINSNLGYGSLHIPIHCSDPDRTGDGAGWWDVPIQTQEYWNDTLTHFQSELGGGMDTTGYEHWWLGISDGHLPYEPNYVDLLLN